jgi:hypothetical protein
MMAADIGEYFVLSQGRVPAIAPPMSHSQSRSAFSSARGIAINAPTTASAAATSG